MSNGSDNDDRNFDTGKFKRVVYEGIGDALDQAAMKLEAIRVNALMADLMEMTHRVRSYESALVQVIILLERARGMVLRAIDERGDDQVLAEVAALLERVANVARALGVGNEQQ